MPNTHCGSPNSASIGQSASTAPACSRYRFHQPVRSDTKCSSPLGDQLGWKIDSARPPATWRAVPSAPSGPTAATHRSVPSHGMFGWSQLSHASCRPSALRQGLEKKSWPSDEHVLVAAVDVDRDQRIDRLAQATAVVLAHGDQAAPRGVEHGIGIAHRRIARQRGRAAGGVEAVQPLVVVLAEPDRIGADREGAAAVLVDAAAHVPRRRRQVADDAAGADPDQHVAAFLVRPALGPADVAAREPDLAEPQARAGDAVGADLRSPAAVGSDAAGDGLAHRFMGRSAATATAPMRMEVRGVVRQ